MGGAIKKLGNAIGLGAAGEVQNTTGMDLNFGKLMADRAKGTNFVAQQQQLANQLMAQAQGQGPSLAQAQLQQATDQNIAQQMAMAASARGGNVGLAQRQAMMNAGQAQQQMAGQSAIARLQEQQQAQQLLGQTVAQGQAGIDSFRTNMTALGNQRDTAQTEAAQKGGGMFGGFLGKVGEGAAALGMFSDERMKENVKPAGKKIESFLDALNAHEYSYKKKDQKKPGAGKGKHVSPMAQELEETELGQGMVEDTDDGKMVDYGKGFGVMMASMAHIHDRLKKIEGKKNG